ncbi:NLI interacting factor family phosphatase [Entamoeba histolytica HM-1:IMSS-B]|uniref:Mitochondrial import inner membrane translocase subunit TIM50 n=6 Tax=Entamoeba histolytica TaxID=5759 RepID=C4LVR8_ENTH1|nr:phosphatase, putative [Entamoeba histolytica HM-1:IMSS]EMD49359.1 phosphatase, putative [Entamoeba histolytica KU27]EMH77502.1 NLI interacting factor family phosphatase [Entamoeba histolytica HM-1:IMSS-B]EMS12022.1 phosphatase [Entamoeba histolytica HM-3:IMSS]ENY64271.1 phosphatase, putative [Entamoeba histolytica HM-1:IMSS-A]GAT92773.1 nli interacting factor-like phosphatase domain-containing protein [Entamoeba histolytica]|eukprot:XP_656420.2 phosphatase, putative [Entamoeba histolytica HM-1:IMSS]
MNKTNYNNIISINQQREFVLFQNIQKECPLLVVFDLDDTLIHTHINTNNLCINSSDIFTIRVNEIKYYCEVRKGVVETLERLSKQFRIMIYTASKKEYADQVVSHLEKNCKLFSKILYREDCLEEEGFIYKTIHNINYNVKRIICIDDNPSAWKKLENVYVCKKYNGGIDDEMIDIENIRTFIKCCILCFLFV